MAPSVIATAYVALQNNPRKMTRASHNRRGNLRGV
jgi:hypothetical protein